ncbi:hypothetical protein AJ79_00459 [Helicocarpus griseus UAMH5409]|uniref:F-box domain-containing protein n=1 Tax=Helicocarpus griseus UAMH5409 TaxID=1447875 RepID=A0A2B7YC00_9EURO|nr:hypothetical protein AJ79_00459 [Helicocarpus griseus UAMH5409]
MNLAGTSSKAQKPGPQVLVHSNDICEQEPLERENPAARALTSLPVELIYSILDFLPLGDPASLSITNRFLSRCIGAKIWSKLKHPENAQEKILFLQNLTKDLSEQRDNCWLCDVCKIFHNYGRNSIVKTINDKIDHFGYGDDSHTYPFGYKLSSELVKMAILRAEKGYSHGICPDRLSCAEIVNVRRPQVRIDYAYRVRVVHGELIVKLGTRFRGDNCNADDNGWENNISECGHDSWPPSFKNVLLQNILGFLTENLRHIKAEYPIIPFDEEKPFSAEYQEPRRDQLLFYKRNYTALSRRMRTPM